MIGKFSHLIGLDLDQSGNRMPDMNQADPLDESIMGQWTKNDFPRYTPAQLTYVGTQSCSLALTILKGDSAATFYF